MGSISLQTPLVGQPNATEDPKVATDFTTLQTWANGNIDAINMSAALAQSATVNQSGQNVKGATNIAASQNTNSTTYTTLGTPDQVSVVMPSNGLFAIWYQATWQASAVGGGSIGAARAAIFIGGNQLRVPQSGAPFLQAAVSPNTVNSNAPLATFPLGLIGTNAAGYTGDVTTGQAIAAVDMLGTGTYVEFAGVAASLPVSILPAGLCFVQAAAGTYTVSVQFKTSSGTVTASNRKLWVQALSFA